MLGQLTEVMSMDDVQVLYPKERITLYGINSNFRERYTVLSSA